MTIPFLIQTAKQCKWFGKKGYAVHNFSILEFAQ
jgi:hypothetical protein